LWVRPGNKPRVEHLKGHSVRIRNTPALPTNFRQAGKACQGQTL